MAHGDHHDEHTRAMQSLSLLVCRNLGYHDGQGVEEVTSVSSPEVPSQMNDLGRGYHFMEVGGIRQGL